MLRFAFTALFVTVLAVSPAQAAQTAQTVLADAAPQDPNQQTFLAGVQAIRSGAYAAAVVILDALADRTGSPRVRLELARALYLDGRFRRARREFYKVYAQKDLPYAVRRTIDVYLADIDQRAGYVEPRVGVAFDTNPGQVASTGVYDLFGVPLTFKRTAGADSPGLTFDVPFAATLNARGLSVVGAVDGEAYTRRGASSIAATGGLRLTEPGLKGWYEAGASVYKRDRGLEVATVFVARSRRFALSGGRQLILTGEVARNQFNPRPELDGFAFQAGGEYDFDVARDVSIAAMAQGVYATARYPVDTRRTGLVGAEMVLAAPRLNKHVLLDLTGSLTGYGAPDPFFGRTRRDLVGRAQLTVLNGTPFKGLFPGVSVAVERNDSSIPFYSYVRKSVRFELRRRF